MSPSSPPHHTVRRRSFGRCQTPTLCLLLLQLADAQPSIEELHAALKAQPESPAAHNNLGLAFKAQGRLEVAIPLFNKAIELDPGYARGYNNLGNAMQSLGEVAVAAGHFRTATELLPTMASGFINLGSALRALERPEDAAHALSRALELNPLSDAAHTNLGAVAQESSSRDNLGARAMSPREHVAPF